MCVCPSWCFSILCASWRFAQNDQLYIYMYVINKSHCKNSTCPEPYHDRSYNVDLCLITLIFKLTACQLLNLSRESEINPVNFSRNLTFRLLLFNQTSHKNILKHTSIKFRRWWRSKTLAKCIFTPIYCLDYSATYKKAFICTTTLKVWRYKIIGFNDSLATLIRQKMCQNYQLDFLQIIIYSQTSR